MLTVSLRQQEVKGGQNNVGVVHIDLDRDQLQAPHGPSFHNPEEGSVEGRVLGWGVGEALEQGMTLEQDPDGSYTPCVQSRASSRHDKDALELAGEPRPGTAEVGGRTALLEQWRVH